MKMFFLFLFCSLHLFSHSFVGKSIDENLEVVYSYYQDEWIVGLSDGSCWKLKPLKEKRKQTWHEWWNQITPKEWSLSEEFFFDPHEWKGRFTVQVYKATNSLFANSHFILMNQNTNQMIFAEYIPHGSNFIPKIAHAQKIVTNAQFSTSAILASCSFVGNILTLEDHSIWKLHLMDRNKQSWSEWWAGIEIDQPDEIFLSKISDWKHSDSIEIYDSQINENELNEKYQASTYTYRTILMHNKTRNKMAYASNVPFNDFLQLIEQYSQKQWKEGYLEGFSKGYQAGEIEGFKKGLKEQREIKE